VADTKKLQRVLEITDHNGALQIPCSIKPTDSNRKTNEPLVDAREVFYKRDLSGMEITSTAHISSFGNQGIFPVCLGAKLPC